MDPNDTPSVINSMEFWTTALPAITAIAGAIVAAVFSNRAQARRDDREDERRKTERKEAKQRRKEDRKENRDEMKLNAKLARGEQKSSEAKRVAIEVYQACTAHVHAGERIRDASVDSDALELANAERDLEISWIELMRAADTAEFLLPENIHPSITDLVQSAKNAARQCKDLDATQYAHFEASLRDARNTFSAAVHDYLESFDADTKVEPEV